MSLTAWERGRGGRQLRVLDPQDFEQTDDAAFVLGSDVAGWIEELEPGDFVEVARSVDLTGYNFITALVNARAPATAPTSGTWRASLKINGTVQTTEELRAGRTRRTIEMRAHVSKITGSQTVSFRLELEP